MKTRIRIVEYGDGRSNYFPQVKHSFKNHLVSMFESEPFWFIIAFALAVPIALIWSSLWDEIEYYKEGEDGDYAYLTKVSDIETAKKAVDNYILVYETNKAQKAAKKLSEKQVKTEYLDYP